MRLVLLQNPASWGADVVVGSTQRFGVPMGYGGPHAAYFACKEAHKRFIPGKIIGVSSGASAPEVLVKDFINELKKQFTIEIEEVEITKENITFKIPGKLN